MFAERLAECAKYRRILTGTPITQSPLDIYSQAKFLHPDAFGTRLTWTAFKNTYAIEKQMIMGTRSFRKVVGYKNLDHLTEQLSKFSIRIMKKDCLDLPEKIYQKHYVELTPEQQQAYDDLRSTALTQIDSGLVTVTTALTLLIKLQQIVSGYVKDDNNAIFNIPNNRVQAVLEILNQDEQKTIIFCAFRVNVSTLRKEIGKVYGHDSVVTYSGGSSIDDRKESIRLFCDNQRVRFLIATSAAAKGLTLTAASRIIYFSQGYNLETRLQSEDRIHRIGQRRHCIYIDLVTRGTTDEIISKALKDKQNLANLVLDDLRKIIE